MNSGIPAPSHIPVMLEEVTRALAVQPGGRYIDCTVGAGGHALSILERSSPGGQVLGIDADPEAIEVAAERLKGYGNAIRLVNDNFMNLHTVAVKYGFTPVHGILFDLGLSSLQLEESGRGFSFQHDAPLDMRFGPGQEITAADIVNKYKETDLAGLIRNYGEEIHSKQIAHNIVRERPVRTTGQLARIVERAVGGRRGKIHPATRTFQALRIAVNKELENLESALEQAVELLGYQGRLVVISYHSLEDRIVKRFIQRESRDCICPPGSIVCVCGHRATVIPVYRKVVTPSPEEVRRNPRSRSARLRAAERTVIPSDCYGSIREPDFLLSSPIAWIRQSPLIKIEVAFAASMN